MRRVTKLLAVTALAMIPAWAGAAAFTPDIIPGAEKNDSVAAVVSTVRKMHRPLTGKTVMNSSQTKLKAPVKRAAANGEKLIYGGVLYADSWTVNRAPFGIYSSTTTAPITVEQQYLGSMFTVQGGGFYNEGKYYFINYEIQTFDGEEYVYTTLYECNIYPFKLLNSYSLSMGNIARDLTFDPIEQKVYGIFSVGNLEARYLIGRMNLDTEGEDFRVTDLVELDDATNQVAIASDARGTIYTIGVDGKLNRLDKENNTLVEIGPTGVRDIEVLYPQSATIDLESGVFYWAALLTDGSSELYTVDTTTGHATRIGAFPDNEEFGGICVPHIPADGAPVGVPELFPTFEDGSLSGIVAFDAPKEAVNGSTLSGNLSYTLSVNGEETFTGEVRAGRRNEEIDITVPDNGWYTFSLTTANAAGRSVAKALRTFIGKDAPVACPSPTAVNHDRGGDVSISWGKSRKGVNGGYVDTLKVSYDVVRMPDNVTIASALTDTVCTDRIDNTDLHTYYYVITPNHENIAGIPAATNKVAVGHIAQVPYVENFDTDVDFSTYTVVHCGPGVVNPGSGWGTWNYTNYKGGVAQSSPTDGYAKDDWLFTPPIHLTAERTYRLSYKAMSQGNSIVPSFIEHMEVKMGTAPDVAHMTTLLVEDCAILNEYGSYLDYEATIHVEQEGEYHIGFHATTPAANLMWMLNIDDVSVTPGAEVKGPARVTDLAVEALPKGELGATLTFNAPARSISNQPLTSIDKIEILRGEEIIETIVSPEPGKKCEYIDNGAAQGLNEYTVVAWADGDRGLTEKRTVFVGFDLPGGVRNAELRDVDGIPTVTWEKPEETGPEGHYVDPDAVTYKVERYFSARDRQTVSEGKKDLEFADTELWLAGQAPVAYVITAVNHLGSGEEIFSNSIFVGNSLSELPLRESFPQCASTSVLAYLSRSEGASWGVLEGDSDSGVAPSDNDGGMAVFYLDATGAVPEEGYTSMLYTNRFSIDGCLKPSVSFYMYNRTGTANGMGLMVNAESKGWEEVSYTPVNNGSTGWNRVIVPLDKYVGSRYVQIGFRGVAHDDALVFIDNILFDDMLGYNLQMGSLNAPGIMELGETVRIEATVVNRGINDASGYAVKFMRGNSLIASINGTPLASGMTATVGIDFKAGIDCEQQNDIYAEIVFAADEKEADNRSNTVSVYVDLPRMSYVNDLTASEAGKEVNLAWSTPDSSTAQPEPETDGFDSYAPFIIDGIGNWTVIDGDRQPTWGISSSVSGQILQYDHAGEAMAWQVFNPVKATLSIDYNGDSDPSGTTVPDWRPRSGSQMLGSFAPRTGASDDWLISPRLTGGVQLVKFFARSILNIYPESFEVLVSTTDAARESFTRVASHTVGMKWTPVAIVLPEDTRYFAVRCVSPNQFALMLDDITYAPDGAIPATAVLRGYNVYVDGVRVTPQPVASTEFKVSTDGYLHEYGVTAVYDIGESRMSNKVSLGQSGLGGVSADNDRLDVRIVADGIMLSATDSYVSVHTPDGRCVWDGAGRGTVKVTLVAGLYLVGDGLDAVKVLVK